MDYAPLSPLFVAGFSICFIVAAAVAFTAAYFYWQRREIAAAFPPDEYRIKFSHSMDIYFLLFAAALAFGLLYLLQYFGYGLYPRHDFSTAIWLRWIFYAVVGGLYMGMLNFVLSEPVRGYQSFWSLFFFIAAYAALYAATISENGAGPRITLAVFTIAFFAVSILALFVPHNKILDADYEVALQVAFSERATWRRLLARNLHKGQRELAIRFWHFVYRAAFVTVIVVVFVGLVLTWFLSADNQMSSVASLYATVLSYLIFDMIFIAVPALFFLFLTLMNFTKKMTVTNKESGHRHLEARFAALAQ